MACMKIHQRLQPRSDFAIGGAAAVHPTPDGRLMTAEAPGQLALAPAEDDEADQQAAGRHDGRGRIGVFNVNTELFPGADRPVFSVNTARFRWA